MMSDDDNDGQMIFGDLVDVNLPDICLTGEEKPRKTLTQETCTDRRLNPDPLRDSRACYRLSHSGGPSVVIFSSMQPQAGLLYLDQHADQRLLLRQHITLRKWTIKTNLNLNIQGLMECENLHVQGLETNLGSLYSLWGIDPSTL